MDDFDDNDDVNASSSGSVLCIQSNQLIFASSIVLYSNKLEFRNRVLLFFVLFAVVLSAIYAGFILVSPTEFFAALLGGIITLAPLIYFGFVEKPDLNILWDPSDVDTYSPHPDFHYRS